MQDVVDVCSGIAFTAGLYSRAVYRRIGQSYVRLEVAQWIADDNLFGIALDPEEPKFGLSPVNGYMIFFCVIVHPDALTVLYLIGIALQYEGIAVARLQIHIGEMEYGTLLLTEADINFSHIAIVFIVKCLVDGGVQFAQVIFVKHAFHSGCLDVVRWHHPTGLGRGLWTLVELLCQEFHKRLVFAQHAQHIISDLFGQSRGFIAP